MLISVNLYKNPKCFLAGTCCQATSGDSTNYAWFLGWQRHGTPNSPSDWVVLVAFIGVRLVGVRAYKDNGPLGLSSAGPFGNTPMG